MIAEIKPGQAAQLEVWRDKAVKRISVTVEELKDKATQAGMRRGGGGNGEEGDGAVATVNRIGLSVRVLTAAEKSQLKATGNVVVVNAKGPAAEAGLRGGDVILSINRIKVDTVAAFETAVKNAGHDATLLIQREGQQSIVTITLQ
jgi:serine protease Do